MMDNNHIIKRAIYIFSRLPGVGERSSQRMILYLIQKKKTLLVPIIKHLDILAQEISTCTICNNLDIGPHCSICTNPSRNKKQICIVEDVSSLWAIEKSKSYKGTYFVLDGTLKANSSNDFLHNKIPQLIKTISFNNVTEVIIATSLTVEGQTTALYIKEEINKLDDKIIVSTLAQGVPVGGEIDYLDELTLETAFKLRKSL